MRKLYLCVAFLCCVMLNVLAVNVTVTMNYTSPTMSLVAKDTGTPVTIGDPEARVYSFTTDPGIYLLTGYDSNLEPEGTLEIEITGEESQEFKITTVSIAASNSGWILDTDYEMDCQANSREGDARTITTVKKEVSIYGVSTLARRFLMHIGDSYNVIYKVSPARIEEGYLDSFNLSNTVTAVSISAATSIPLGVNYTVTAPEGATLYVGWKRGAIMQSSGGTHYVPFNEVEPVSSSSENGKTTYQFFLGKGCTYNYRVSQEGKLTNGGIFTMTPNVAPLEITADMLNLQNPKYINHDVTANSGANVADILMNINAEGYLKMKSGDTHQLINLRSWQLTDNSTNNYFIEPDYHYTIIGLDGKPSDTVIEIDENKVIRTKGKGTAIVQVTYDAINLQIHNTSQTETPTSYYYGPLWSAIWPENTGTFVVSVDELEDPGIVRNMNIQEEQREDGKSIAVDTEHDIFYYLEDTEGYSYTFKPEGVKSVSIASPTVDANISKYSGFKNVSANEDGSYTVLLTFGRNIIKLTSASGASEYQIVTAKPVSYVINNKTNPGEKIQPGDKIQVQFSGFFHPANKLAGIYNMSGYVFYNGVPNGSSLILGPGQYTFAGNPKAQEVNIEIPEDWDTETPFDLKNGALQILGYGSVIGKHRDISVVTGINPNFTAVVRVQYFGAIPDVSIPISATDYYEVNFTGMPEDAVITVYDRDKAVVEKVEEGKYSLPYGPYTYVVRCEGYRVNRTGLSISSESPKVQTIEVKLEAIDNTGWDGKTLIEPNIVSAEESNVENGQFEGMEGFYKISSGYELAWFANSVSSGNSEISAVVINNIDLAGYDWTPIGNSTATNRYAGVFEGANYKVERLYIDVTTNNQGLFGYLNGATIKNVTVRGSITSTNNNIGGIAGNSAGASVIENCINEVEVYGKQYVGGILGYSANAALRIENSHNKADVKSVVTSGSSYVGGIIGYIATGTNVVINKVSNTGNVTGSTLYVGGITGNAPAATISNAANYGNITGTSTNYISGISGYTYAPGTITNAFNAGTITTNYSNYLGGAINGLAGDNLINCYAIEGNYTDAPSLKSAEAFAYGEVAWLLGEAFGQEIGVDTLPVLGGKIVYQAEYASNLSSQKEAVYTNGVLPLIEKEGYKTLWYDAPYGNIIAEISENSSLYLLFIEIDNIAPVQPQNLTGEPMETTIDLMWDESTDNVGVTGYNIYLNGIFETIVRGTSHRLTRLAPATSYSVEVEAFDEVGNKSEKASITIVTLDKTVPTQPANLTKIVTDTSITISWTPSTDNVAVTGYNIYVDGELKGTSTEPSYIISGLIPLTEYIVEVEAYDAAGNKSTKLTVSIKTVDSLTSIDNPEESEVRLYPNPVHDFLTIKAGGEIIENVIITDLAGNRIFTDFNESKEFRIPVSGWSEGVYLVKLQMENTTKTHKVVKK